MSDNLNSRGPQDRSRINVNEDWELRYWAESLGVSKEELKRVVEEVGTSAEAVKARLKK